MSTVFGSTQSHSRPTSHRAQIPSSDEISSNGGELEFARSNDDDDDDDSSRMEDQQEQGGSERKGVYATKEQGSWT